MSNAPYRRTLENVRKHQTGNNQPMKRHLVEKANYHTRKWFSENLLVVVINKTEVTMIKSVYLGPSILDMSKIVMYVYHCTRNEVFH